MIGHESVWFRIAWILLAIIGVAIFAFGLLVTVWPGSSDALYLRAIGVAATGMGLFGALITVIPYRRRERWAWFSLWYYPLFWLAHLLGGLPPGPGPYPSDRIHRALALQLADFDKGFLPAKACSSRLMNTKSGRLRRGQW
jgi:hypothetical protein